MKQVIKKATAFLSVYYAYMLEYRAELLLWALSGTLPLILMGVWVEASEEGQFGLTPTDFVRYFLIVFLIRQFTVVWVIWEFEKEVVEGKLSPRLLQPIDPVWHHVASHLSERLARLPFALGLVGFCFLLYPQAAWVPNPGRVLLFLPVLALAFALRFLMQYTFALFAFWTERASAIEQFSLLFYLFLSGLIAPLEVFPPTVREIALWTPFPYMIHFPASILIGLPVNIVRGLLVMLGWGIVFFICNRWLWRKGLKQYSGMGA
ncbi:MAG: ABC-2 family transporter protein [Kastovskya adunca ATA6-11-RM4]|jgi:ABC-2 type transport system permease protein|nr:ABC-2 family transporter protein [Kastovskya adunca ATA6-11-RM4]